MTFVIFTLYPPTNIFLMGVLEIINKEVTWNISGMRDLFDKETWTWSHLKIA